MYLHRINELDVSMVKCRFIWNTTLQKQLIGFAFFVMMACVTHAQSHPEKRAWPLDVKQLHSGHSLTDPLFHPWPGQYVTLMTDHFSAPFDAIQKSTTPGSPMFWRWEHEVGYDQPDARLDISDWELLVITESVPLGFTNHGLWLSRFANNAWENGNNGEGAATMLWTTWTHIDDAKENDGEYAGPFRLLLDEYEPIWEAMADSASANLPDGAPPIYLIPGHRMMARLYDDIEKGEVPGITNINQFFSDYIHPNYYGAYAMTMIHYACIFNVSPLGLPNDLGAGEIPIELATYLQTMIWEVVTGYDRTGVVDSTATHSTEHASATFVYPNPTHDYLIINSPNNSRGQELYLYNLNGKLLKTGAGKRLDLTGLQHGSYLLQVKGTFHKVIKW